MYSSVKTAALQGIDSINVSCEADVSDGLPVFDLVGFLSTEVRESRERVRTALRNTGINLPAKRITINISPASIRKSGTSFDLPIAASILAAIGIIPEEILHRVIMIGELSLYGDVLPIKGVLPVALSMKDSPLNSQENILIVPRENASEAALCPGLNILPITSLRELIQVLSLDQTELKSHYFTVSNRDTTSNDQDSSIPPDFKDLQGQKVLRRSLEVAASGGHHVLLIGPPGSGKTMAAKLLPTILPPMTSLEQLKLSKIYSVSGLLKDNQSLMSKRPYRAPHHTITSAGLTGGGSKPCPGEISLATSGVLFLDELPEFQKKTLENLREPLEEKTVTIVRNNNSITYPADFLMICAMNPCPCGHYPDLSRCRCSHASISNYLSKISQPLLDRIDLTVEAKEVSFQDLISTAPQESSQEIRQRVIRTRAIQEKRFQGLGYHLNSQIPVRDLNHFCSLTEDGTHYMESAYHKEGLTARSFHRILRVARTLADMDQEENISTIHLMEAVSYRSMDKKYWENDYTLGGLHQWQ